MDGDGQEDILGTAFGNGVAWWRNGGNDTAWTKLVISDINSAVISWGVDIDNDEDLDVVGSAQDISVLAVWQNDGQFPANYTYQLVDNLGGAWPLHYGDLDNDGDNDLVCGGNSAHAIMWYENELITTSIVDNKVQTAELLVSPNPFSNSLSVELVIGESTLVQFTLLNNLGEVVANIPAQSYVQGVHTIHLNEMVAGRLIPGIYFARVVTPGEVISKKLIKF